MTTHIDDTSTSSDPIDIDDAKVDKPPKNEGDNSKLEGTELGEGPK